jgi:N-ethylmaleimide reductase
LGQNLNHRLKLEPVTMKLFTPFKLGPLELPNRIVMAPLTRTRADSDTLAANDLIAEMYAQRADAGLLIAEASQVSQQGMGYENTPGVYTPAQVAGWRKVTDRVHKAGGRIFLQLWHVGRISHTALQPGGAAPVSSSTRPAGTKVLIGGKFDVASTPRALEIPEIQQIVRDFAHGAQCAKDAGFDGVEVHSANGYLIEQFLKDGCNDRTDAYGGSIQNRCRFGLEVLEAVIKVWGKDRVGVRLSPVTPANGISNSDSQALFNYYVSEINKLAPVYIHVIEGSTGGPRDNEPFDYNALRQAFSGCYMANNGYTRDMAEDAVSAGRADLIAFGKPFIPNPDLVERLRTGAPLAEITTRTLYGQTAEGYTDYPRYKAS